jgi:hypothetical protein
VAVKLYADRPRRVFGQLVGDLAALAWTVVWVRAGFAVHDAVLALAAPGRKLEDAGGALERNLRSAGETASRLPVVGDDLRTPFDAAAGAGRTLADAGRDQQALAASAALVLAAATVVVPLLLALWWLARRVRWVREAGAAGRLVAGGADPALFALRALASQPLARLRAVSADPLSGWRDGDPEVVAALARLELARLGVRAAKPR